jgi:hypothetical protein
MDYNPNWVEKSTASVMTTLSSPISHYVFPEETAPATAPPIPAPAAVITAVPPAMPKPPLTRLPPPRAAKPAELAAAPFNAPAATPKPAALAAAPIAGAIAQAAPPVAAATPATTAALRGFSMAATTTLPAPFATRPVVFQVTFVAILVVPHAVRLRNRKIPITVPSKDVVLQFTASVWKT